MREILFRAKRVDNAKWVEGSLLVTVLNTYIVPFHNDTVTYQPPYSVFPETVGQFTGLTDTKRQKIFEGDKIKFKYHLEEFEIANVFWSPDYLGFFTNTNSANHPLYDLSEIEIIGNIHDNKEDKA